MFNIKLMILKTIKVLKIILFQDLNFSKMYGLDFFSALIFPIPIY